MRKLIFRHWNTIHKKMNYGGCMGTIGNKIVQDERNIVLQFTGMKDTSGRDIYEGDILKIGDSVHEVYWDKRFAEWGLSATNSLGWFFNYRQYSDKEVIGNSCENPELLKHDGIVGVEE